MKNHVYQKKKGKVDRYIYSLSNLIDFRLLASLTLNMLVQIDPWQRYWALWRIRYLPMNRNKT